MVVMVVMVRVVVVVMVRVVVVVKVRVVVVVMVVVVLLVLLLVLVVVVVGLIVVKARNNSGLLSPQEMFSSVHRIFSLLSAQHNLIEKILIKSSSFTWQPL